MGVFFSSFFGTSKITKKTKMYVGNRENFKKMALVFLPSRDIKAKSIFSTKKVDGEDIGCNMIEKQTALRFMTYTSSHVQQKKSW